MSILKIKKTIKDNKIIKKYVFLDRDIIVVEKNQQVKWYLLGVKILSYKNKDYPVVVERNKDNFDKILEVSQKAKYLILWIDHSLGGGTETYSYNCFNSSDASKVFLRLQFFSSYGLFVLSVPKEKKDIKLSFNTLTEVFTYLYRLPINEVVVNNLVGYPKSTDVLRCVEKFKENNTNIKVSFRGHDYQCICPSFTLLDCNNNYCNLKFKDGCDNCLKSKKIGKSEYQDKMLRSGFVSMEEWRLSWKSFFCNTLDEFIVFSQEVAEIFIKVYPVLRNKTIIIPHSIADYPIVKIPSHESINIGVLGNISLIQKGSEIIKDMIKILDNYENVNLKIIGSYKQTNKKVTITGKYKPNELPAIIEREQIDIVFIPSICPETFSYTTAEAMAMGCVIACFKLGAPYERVRAYDKGIIIDEIDAQIALEQMVNHIEYLRKLK